MIRFINRYLIVAITIALTIASVGSAIIQSSLRAQSPDARDSVAFSSSDEYSTSLALYEGCHTVAYEDNGKQWTVGIGHRLCSLKDGPPAQLTYNLDEVKVFYDNDLEQTLTFLCRDEPSFDSLPLNARLVMVHLVWTNGISGYKTWHRFRFAIHHRQWKQAVNELHSSKWWWQVSRSRREWMVSLLSDLSLTTAATQH